jgi:alpha-glucuronidase
MYRAFVYGPIDERDWKADRATAAVDRFEPLDGDFADNVVIQIKYGPLDFQVREAVSPLFTNMRNANLAIEFQVSPEYLGQDCHFVYLPPLWRTILDFDLQVQGEKTTTTDVYTGKVFNNTGRNGFVGVTNVGLNATWLGSHLATSNLYAFGKLAWYVLTHDSTRFSPNFSPIKRLCFLYGQHAHHATR